MAHVLSFANQTGLCYVKKSKIETRIMQMQTEESEDGITIITLIGKLDIAGTQEIDVRFTALTATRKGLVIVDLSQVSFLASIGIRTLVSSAKALARHGGKAVLLKPQPAVENVLKTSGIDAILPIFHDLETAQRTFGDPGV